MDRKRQTTIDGLRVRSGGARRQLGFADSHKIRTADSRTVAVPVRKAAVPRKQAEIVLGRRGQKIVATAPKKRVVQPISVRSKSEHERKDAIEDFMAEVRDEEPTNLVKENKAKEDKKNKEAPRERRALRWKWFVLIPIIVVLAAAMLSVLAVELGWWDVQGQLTGGEMSLPVIIVAGLDIVWNMGGLSIVRWMILALIVGLLVLAARNDEKIFGIKRGRAVLFGSIATIILLIGVVAWKGVAVWNGLNDALSAMTGGKVNIGDIQQADPTIPLKTDANGRTNVLVIGTSEFSMDAQATNKNDAPWLADTIIVLSLDQEAGDVKMISLPRDIPTVDRCTATGKINETYYCNYSDYTSDTRYAAAKDSPAELAKLRWEYEELAMNKFASIAGEITGLTVQYWAHVNWNTLTTIVDAIGGIDVAIEYEGNKDSYTGDLPVIWTTDPRGLKDNVVKFDAGTVAHLDGPTALELGRARNSFTNGNLQYGIDNNWGREKIQQTLIGAIVAKAKTTNFVKNLDSALGIVQSLGDNLRMSFDAEGIRRGFSLADTIDVAVMQQIDIRPLLTTSNAVCDVRGSGISYVCPRAGAYDYSDIAAHVAKELTAEPFEAEAAKIDMLNGTEQTGLAAKVSGELTNKGYLVGEVGNTPEGSLFTSTEIYRVGGGAMPATEKALLKEFGVSEVKTGALPEGIASTADFVVILGADNL